MHPCTYRDKLGRLPNPSENRHNQRSVLFALTQRAPIGKHQTGQTDRRPRRPIPIQILPRCSKWIESSLVPPAAHPSHRFEHTTCLRVPGHPATTPPLQPWNRNARVPMALAQNAQRREENQSRVNLRYFTRCGPTLPRRFLRFSSYSLYVPSNQYTWLSPSKARIWVQMRSRK